MTPKQSMEYTVKEFAKRNKAKEVEATLYQIKNMDKIKRRNR